MESSLRLGKLGGIEIGVHFTWLIVFGLLTTSLALGFFPETFPGMAARTYWLIGAVSVVLLFAAVLVHELAHSIVAQRRGLQVKSITLFIFGGVSNIGGEPRSAKDELLITLAGPLSSLIIGLVFGGLLVLFRGNAAQPVTAVLFYLASVNILLAVFNLVPGFPLDGGRVLRAIVWAVADDFRKATEIAAGVGQLAAYGFIFGGLYLAFSGSLFSGLWLAFIGWFLNGAAESSRRQVAFQEAFGGVEVGQLMNPDPVSVSPSVTLQQLVDGYVLARNVRALPVVEHGELLGLITLNDLHRIPHDRWSTMTVREAMTPTERLVVVDRHDRILKALQAMGDSDLGQLPVVEDRRFVGLLSRSNLLRFVQIREELGTTA